MHTRWAALMATIVCKKNSLAAVVAARDWLNNCVLLISAGLSLRRREKRFRITCASRGPLKCFDYGTRFGFFPLFEIVPLLVTVAAAEFGNGFRRIRARICRSSGMASDIVRF